METSQKPIIPTRQAMVRIAGYEILAICMEGGSIGAGVRMICGLLGVDLRGQIRKLQTDPDFRDSLILARVEIAGKQRVVWFIIAEFIPLWLKGIHPSKVAPEARETLEEIRSVAVQTLHAFFSQTREQPQGPPKEEWESVALPPPEPQPFPPLGDEKRYGYWGHMFVAHEGLERHLRDIDACLLALTRQIAQLGQVVNQHATILDRHREALLKQKELLEQHQKHLRARPEGSDDEVKALAEQVRQLEAQVSTLAEQVRQLEVPRPLTAEHQVEVRTLLQVLAHQTGQPAGVVERELGAAFGVEGASQLAEAAWDKIVAWLHGRLGWL